MALINPVKTAGNLNVFLSALVSAFGEHTVKYDSGRIIYYLDDAHSLGFDTSTKIYIGSTEIYSGYTGNTNFVSYYIFGKNKSCIYFRYDMTAYGTRYAPTLIAAKASSGKWNVLFKDNAKEEAAKLYFNAPQSNFIVHEPALIASAANAPYIISPYPDINGGVMSELFRVDYLSGFDPQNPPVLVVGDDLYAVPPYPLTASDTAAFAVPIDPADYE